MKRFAILRDLEPTMTWEEADAGAIENMMAMPMGLDLERAFDPKVLEAVKWVRSYWAPGTRWGLCLYVASDQMEVEYWHNRCEVPFVEIREVDEHAAGEVAYNTGWHGTPDDSGLIAAEGPADVDLVNVLPGEAAWVRSYVDDERGRATALISSPGDEDDLIAALDAKGWTTHRVVELKPSDYGVEFGAAIEMVAKA